MGSVLDVGDAGGQFQCGESGVEVEDEGADGWGPLVSERASALLGWAAAGLLSAVRAAGNLLGRLGWPG